MKTENMYHNKQKRSEVKEEARRLRRKFLRYQQAEIVYNMFNKFKDISILEELESLEAININKTPINNLEVLLECPSLKLVCYVAKNETEESILKMLEEKGIIIVQKEWEFVDQLEQLKIKNRG